MFDSPTVYVRPAEPISSRMIATRLRNMVQDTVVTNARIKERKWTLKPNSSPESKRPMPVAGNGQEHVRIKGMDRLQADASHGVPIGLCGSTYLVQSQKGCGFYINAITRHVAPHFIYGLGLQKIIHRIACEKVVGSIIPGYTYRKEKSTPWLNSLRMT